MAPAALIPATTPVPTADSSGSATFRALAWSQDDDSTDEPLPYTGGEYLRDTGTTRAVSQYVQPTGPIGVDEPRSWQRLPLLVFGLGAVAALVAVGGVAIALTSTAQDSSPPPSSTQAPAPPPPVVEHRETAATTTATTEAPPQNIVTVTSEAPPPPPKTVTVERPAPTTQHHDHHHDRADDHDRDDDDDHDDDHHGDHHHGPRPRRR